MPSYWPSAACTRSSITSSSWHRRLAARAVLATARYAQTLRPPSPDKSGETEMGEKRVSLRHEGGLRFVAGTGSGHDVVMDNAGGDTGPRPTEVLLAAIAGCTAMDVVEILAKKGQAYTRYSTEVTGVQRETAPNVFTEITVLHVVEGDVETAAVRRS